MRKSDQRAKSPNNAPRSAAHAAVVAALRALRAAPDSAAARAALGEAVQSPGAWGPSGSLFITARSGAWWAGDRSTYFTLHLNSRRVAEVEVDVEFGGDSLRHVRLVPRDEAEAEFRAARTARREAAAVAAADAAEVRRLIAAATRDQRGAMFSLALTGAGANVPLAGGMWFDGGFIRRPDERGMPANAAVLSLCEKDHAAWSAAVDAGFTRVMVAVAEAAHAARESARMADAERQIAALKRRFRAAA
jgi:hypothetical protein